MYFNKSLSNFTKLAILQIVIKPSLEESVNIDEDKVGNFFHHDAFIENVKLITERDNAIFNQIAQSPPRNISSDKYGRLIITYLLENLNNTFLTNIFERVSEIHNQQHLWPPLIVVRLLETDANNDPFQILLSFVNNISWNFPINSDFYFIYILRNQLEVLEIYNIRNVTFIEKVHNGVNNRGALNYYSLLQKDKRRSNFRKLVMVAVTMDVHGYELASDFDDDNSTETRFIGGFEVSFYRYLKDALNFTEQALKGYSYIREGPNQTLTGMAVQINKGFADICISSTEFLEYRASGPDGISYLLPTFNLGMQAYFKQPPASSIRDVFTSAFSLNLWLFLFCLWVFICLSMKLAFRIYVKNGDSFTEINWNEERMSDEISIWAAGAMCQQGWHFTPEWTGTRIIFFFGWFTGFLCYIAFSAQLVSILSVEVVPIKSFEDLLRDNFFIYNDNHIPTTKYFVKGLQQRGIIPTVEEQLRNVDIEANFAKMLKTKSAMVSISDSLFPILQKMGITEGYICSTLSDVKIGSRVVIMSMVVKRSSPTRGIFNAKILQMLERGVNYRILSSYFKQTSVQCLKDGSGLNVSMGFRDLFTAYGILLSGFILSGIISILEYVFRKLWKGTKLLTTEEIANSSDIAMYPNFYLGNIHSDNPSNANNIYNIGLKQTHPQIY